MAKPIQIPVASDTRDFTKGIDQGVVKPLEEVSTALDDLGRDGQRAGDKLESGLRDSQKATENLEGDVKSLHKVIDDGSRGSFKGFVKHADDGMDRAGDKVGEFKDEARSNLSEVASSFQGDMSSAVDGIQGTLGGLAMSPVLGKAGLIAAAGGLAFGAIANAALENSEKAKERIRNMYEDMLESGASFISDNMIQEELQKIWGEADDTAVSLAALKELSDNTGLSQAEWATAYAGDADARARIIEHLTQKEKDLQAQYEGATEAQIVQLDATGAAYSGAWEAIRNMSGETLDAKTKVESYRDSVLLLKNDYEKAADAALVGYGQARDAVATFNQELANVDTSKEIAVKVKTDPTNLVRQIRSALQGTTFTVPVTVRARAGSRVQ